MSNSEEDFSATDKYVKDDGYSVLMSVYAREDADYLRAAVESILTQTLPPAQFVLVCDGPLTAALQEVVNAYADNPVFCVLPLGENHGLGYALNHGIQACKYEYIARMDSDDLAKPYRCEKQLAYMSAEQLDLSSGTVAEFFNDPQQIISYRRLPQYHSKIKDFAFRRNPMNHPAVMFRKSAVEQAGGYRVMPYFEDYDLWIRMLKFGFKTGNLPDILVEMRTSADFYCRRGGGEYCKAILNFYKTLNAEGSFSTFVCIKSIIIRWVAAMIPGQIRKMFYNKCLRSIAGDQKS